MSKTCMSVLVCECIGVCTSQLLVVVCFMFHVYVMCVDVFDCCLVTVLPHCSLYPSILMSFIQAVFSCNSLYKSSCVSGLISVCLLCVCVCVCVDVSQSVYVCLCKVIKECSSLPSAAVLVSELVKEQLSNRRTVQWCQE